MANALKWDRCGKFYIFQEEFSHENEKEIRNEIEKFKPIRYLRYSMSREGAMFQSPDLCIDCIHEFCNWFNRTSEINPKFPMNHYV